MKSFSDPFCRNIFVVTTSIDWRFPTVFYQKSQKHVRFHSTTWSTTCFFLSKRVHVFAPKQTEKRCPKKFRTEFLRCFSTPDSATTGSPTVRRSADPTTPTWTTPTAWRSSDPTTPTRTTPTTRRSSAPTTPTPRNSSLLVLFWR